jgi:D-serine deaminase-like pyridoxal phosphate-dependent protein
MTPASPLAPSEAPRLHAAIAEIADRLLTPALVIDLDAVAHNARAFVRRCGDPGRWRPHVKTVKQPVVIDVLWDAGVRAFKCATPAELRMVLEVARARAALREVDVLVAYPPGPAVLAEILRVRADASGARVAVLADSPEHLRALDDLAPHGDPIDVHLDVDLGMGRTGTPPSGWREAPAPRRGARITGLHGYDGHLHADERDTAHAGYDALVELSRARDVHGDLVTSGTHSYAHALSHDGLSSGPWRHQVSPGTIVLGDLRSTAAAADLGLRQAAFVASRVVSVAPSRVTLDAGSKGIAPDCPSGSCGVVGFEGLVARTPSEEHLPMEVQHGDPPHRGQLLWLVPSHVCTTVNLYDEVVYLRAGKFHGVGRVAARGHAPVLGGTS